MLVFPEQNNPIIMNHFPSLSIGQALISEK